MNGHKGRKAARNFIKKLYKYIRKIADSLEEYYVGTLSIA
jgi:hypothetical protein